jgi:hypothetical protein
LVDVLKSRPLIGCRENTQELTFQRRLPPVYDFTEAQAAVASKSSFRGLSSGLLEGFSKLVSNFTGASQTLEFDFCIKLETKKEKLSAHVQKVSIYCYKHSKKIFIS